MNEQLLELYWSELPTEKENAVDYATLCDMWGREERTVRSILHELSHFDNGDDFVLIRSSKYKGFFKTDDVDEIRAYKQECLSRGRNVFAPVRKINRVLNAANDTQFSIANNLRQIREARGLKQSDVCKHMKKFDRAFDKSLLSKMENGVCLPTYQQRSLLAQIFDCEADFLCGEEFLY